MVLSYQKRTYLSIEKGYFALVDLIEKCLITICQTEYWKHQQNCKYFICNLIFALYLIFIIPVMFRVFLLHFFVAFFVKTREIKIQITFFREENLFF